ncbi:ceramide-1-phosphate transfer protein-like [Boleophthalmus pectinirostris]|uniref:ceramide-1-phosphate transfer protein-like n=1 Tax=Boleophthalmus pectinirostris TaxID=150288 RepID=UPI00242BE30F|nr:ceramide-1-phosphate transfer protein-like [Boleophthalmus pectinirostris]
MRRNRLRVLVTATILALMLFISSFWLPQGGGPVCGSEWHPCLTFYENKPEPKVDETLWEGSDLNPAFRECPGQSFQSSVLMRHLGACLSEEGDVLMESYLQSWDQLILFMESLGTMVSFFSHKVKDKVALIRQLSVKQTAGEDHGQHGLTPEAYGLRQGVYRTVRSMVEAELKQGLVGFSFRTESGCRTLLRLHRSLLWVKLVLQGLTEDPDQNGVYKTPGEIGREAYSVALAPHHSWFLQRAAELVFVALPERKYFFQQVCVNSQSEAVPALRIIIRALTRVHERTQVILEHHRMLLLP